ncbi:hypothetical protein BDW74DRAFT_181165 [Aspergillus multicolor]|uniref:uncharacterized protein n=1 Tax=Aspergillus multicolor TaxID=41759 RepID=UPI003CCD0C94
MAIFTSSQGWASILLLALFTALASSTPTPASTSIPGDTMILTLYHDKNCVFPSGRIPLHGPNYDTNKIAPDIGKTFKLSRALAPQEQLDFSATDSINWWEVTPEYQKQTSCYFFQYKYTADDGIKGGECRQGVPFSCVRLWNNVGIEVD